MSADKSNDNVPTFTDEQLEPLRRGLYDSLKQSFPPAYLECMFPDYVKESNDEKGNCKS